MRILGIDPGNALTAYALIEMPEFRLIRFEKIANEELRERRISELEGEGIDDIAIEMVASYGMPVGREVFETCVWIGRFMEFLAERCRDAHWIYRAEEKMTLCKSMKAKDGNIRQALIDRYAKFDLKNGKGTKSNPDIFYGVSADVWQAIAVAVTYYEKVSETKK